MRVYVETGILIDYLAQGRFPELRSAQRRGRQPIKLYEDARDVLALIAKSHLGAVSAFSFYEVEEALLKEVSKTVKDVPNRDVLRLQATRPILLQAIYAVRLFGLEVLSLTESAVDLVANSAILANRGIRAADAMHVMTAVNFDADLILSGDKKIIRLNSVMQNSSGHTITCCDSEAGLTKLAK